MAKITPPGRKYITSILKQKQKEEKDNCDYSFWDAFDHERELIESPEEIEAFKRCLTKLLLKLSYPEQEFFYKNSTVFGLDTYVDWIPLFFQEYDCDFPKFMIACDPNKLVTTPDKAKDEYNTYNSILTGTRFEWRLKEFAKVNKIDIP